MLTRIQIACMTPKTRLEFDGAKITRSDLSIHATTNRRKRSELCTMPPRQRSGATYAGGRHLRRAHKRLALRQQGYKEGEGNKPGRLK